MTDQKFIFLPRIGERIYKTGDVGQYDEAGIIEFLGRSDNQVKVRGHRIELTEIDSILSENKELDDVVSIIVGDAQEDRRIVTVAVPKQAEVATEDTSQETIKLSLKENNGKGCLKSIKQISCISSQKREPLWKWLGRLFMWSDLRKTIFVRIKIICWMNWKEGYRSI